MRGTADRQDRLLPAMWGSIESPNDRLKTPLAQCHWPGATRPERIILRCLNRSRDGLCGHPEVRDAAGRTVAFVDHTNNVIEQFFGLAKHGLRRHLGGEAAASRLRADPVRHARQIASGPRPTGPRDLQRSAPLAAQQPGCGATPAEPGVGQGSLTPAAPVRSILPSNPPRTTGL